MDEKTYIQSLESLVCFYAQCYEKCKETYRDKYLSIVDIRNPERRELTDFETEILMSFPLIQGLSNQYPTQELSKIKIEAKMSIKDVFEVIKSKHCI